MTVTDNAALFATIPPAAIDQERRSAVQEAVRLIDEGMPGRAEYVMVRSVLRQLTIAGVGHGDELVVPCPCGGRCTS